MSRKLVLLTTLIIVLIGLLSVASKVQRVKANPSIYIRADGSVDPPGAPIHRDGDLYTVNCSMTIVDTYGIVIERDNMTLDGAGNALQGNGSGTGIYLSGRSNVTIKNTKIKTFDEGVHFFNSSNNTMVGNNITNNSCAIVIIHYSSNNSIIENNITNSRLGIVLSHALNNAIVGNNITANEGIGIQLFSSSNYTSIAGNNITNNSCAIIMNYPSNHISIVENCITANRGISIVFSSSNCSSILANNITNNVGGVLLTFSSNNVISGNNITANNMDGIRLVGSSDYNVISENNITNNTYGARLERSSKNTFHHNNFVDNGIQAEATASNNTWNEGFPSGGNYWSDYDGTDGNKDGIGDAPYLIYDFYNTSKYQLDNYPLMGMFNSFNTSLGYHVNVITNSTIEDFEYFESNRTIKMHVSGEEGSGFCRVSIPHVLMDVSNISVIIDDGVTPVLYPNYTLHDNGTQRWIYFAYEHSTHKIDIIPEFPSKIILSLFMISTLIAVIVCKRVKYSDKKASYHKVS